ncbi:branched-chain amino acid ABC transporter substrate-binding protein [Duganella violaceipulchra]|uniref:ABC-type branched-subunit amino acid transport system substrate-binding protein n=1 Tax=Duganella violaceipulchra TaxID=2849652 RepID=A0AA41L4G0_9BURK|nr:branched-chain amino acid ABC transporter substrate-binding protein [Duganella violaceicalia]MBV6325243.1 branched-chain amino acid ABC transporter substrate-binding protein [Duganella violaceicalia]MCP2012456.1 ABC-type branched-subunit amino acid transport system substrate-binding protein [Duganella violaceicalia]
MKLKHIAAAVSLTLLGAAGAQAQDTVVKIGHSGPLSGAQAFSGKDNENGARLAVEELNAKPITVAGKKLKFELQSEDDQGDPKAGVAAAQKLIDQGVKYVVGPYNSGVAIPASRAYNDAGVLIATVATNPKITQQGYKGLFRVNASDSQLGTKMALYAANELKLKTVAVIDDRTAFGQGVAEEFKKQAKAAGMTVAGHEFTTDKAFDFTAILTKLKTKKVEAIFFGGYAPQGAPMARQMKQLGINAKLLGGDTICTAEMGKLGGDAVGENVLCSQGGAILDKFASGPAFKAKYKARFKQDPDVYAAAYYDAAMMYAQTMVKVNSIDPQKVGAAISAGSYKGVAGTYSFDEHGDMKQSPVTIFNFKGGQPVPLTTY